MAKVINASDFQDNPVSKAGDSTLLKVNPNQLDVGILKYRSFNNAPSFKNFIINPNSEEDFLISGSPLMKVGVDGNVVIVDLAKKQSNNSYPEVISFYSRLESDVINNTYNKTTGLKYSKVEKNKVVQCVDLSASSVEFDATVLFGEDVNAEDEITYSDNGLSYIKWTSGKVKLGIAKESAKANTVGIIRVYN